MDETETSCLICGANQEENNRKIINSLSNRARKVLKLLTDGTISAVDYHKPICSECCDDLKTACKFRKKCKKSLLLRGNDEALVDTSKNKTKTLEEQHLSHQGTINLEDEVIEIGDTDDENEQDCGESNVIENDSLQDQETKTMKFPIENSTERGHKQEEEILKKRHKCTMEGCYRSYVHKGDVTRHIKLDHYNIRTKCPLCNKAFRDNAALRLHYQRIHDLTMSSRTLVCDTCYMAFDEPHKLKTHCKTHSRDKNWFNVCV